MWLDSTCLIPQHLARVFGITPQFQPNHQDPEAPISSFWHLDSGLGPPPPDTCSSCPILMSHACPTQSPQDPAPHRVGQNPGKSHDLSEPQLPHL